MKVLFHPDAAKGVARLDNGVKLLVLKQIKKLSITPGLGSELGNRHGINLSGYRKLYADKKKIRIVYKIVDEKVLVQINQFNQPTNLTLHSVTPGGYPLDISRPKF